MIKPRSEPNTIAMEPSPSSRIRRRRGVVAVMWIHGGVAVAVIWIHHHGVGSWCSRHHPRTPLPSPCSSKRGRSVRAAGRARRKIEPRRSETYLSVWKTDPEGARVRPCRRTVLLIAAGDVFSKTTELLSPLSLCCPFHRTGTGERTDDPRDSRPQIRKDSSYHAIIWAVFIGRTACIGYVTLVLKKI
jgi:hypothetical protein